MVPTITFERFLQSVGARSYCSGSADYQRGVNYADCAEYVTVALNDVWGAKLKNGGSVSSYERIGYHSGSVDFIAGVYYSGCAVYVFREDGHGRITRFRLGG